MNTNTRILAIKALFRNDEEHGFLFHLGGADLHEAWTMVTERAESCWRYEVQRGQREEMVAFLLAQCRAYERGASLPGLSIKETGFQLAGNIYLLEKYGELEVDEYNGLALIAADGRGIIHVLPNLHIAEQVLQVVELRDSVPAGRA